MYDVVQVAVKLRSRR